MAISFAVQGELASRLEWIHTARRAEELGFEAVSIADHPGSTASPFVALAAASQVTSRILLTPAVVNAGAWEPLALAGEVATLDELSEGRAVLGIGAGHTPKEWLQVGRDHPTPGQRLDHLEAIVSSVRRLLSGERVTIEHGAVQLRDAALDWWGPGRRRIPFLIGGNARPLVGIAARHADVLELTGLGRTLPDGHAHEPQWSTAGVEARRLRLRAEGGDRVRLGALVQKVEITTDRLGAAEEYRSQIAGAVPERHLPSLDALLDTPFVLIGTEDQIAAQVRTNRVRWGVTRYTVRANVMDVVAGIIDRVS